MIRVFSSRLAPRHTSGERDARAAIPRALAASVQLRPPRAFQRATSSLREQTIAIVIDR